MEIQTYRREQPFGIITRRRYSATDNSVVHRRFGGTVVSEHHSLSDRAALALIPEGFTRTGERECNSVNCYRTYADLTTDYTPLSYPEWARTADPFTECREDHR